MKTLGIPEDLHKELMRLRLDEGDKNVTSVLRKMLHTYKEKQFLENSKKFKEMLKKSGKSFEQFLEDARRIKEEVVNEEFPD